MLHEVYRGRGYSPASLKYTQMFHCLRHLHHYIKQAGHRQFDCLQVFTASPVVVALVGLQVPVTLALVALLVPVTLALVALLVPVTLALVALLVPVTLALVALLVPVTLALRYCYLDYCHSRPFPTVVVALIGAGAPVSAG